MPKIIVSNEPKSIGQLQLFSPGGLYQELMQRNNGWTQDIDQSKAEVHSFWNPKDVR